MGKILFVFLVLLTSQLALAGPRVGNGGDAFDYQTTGQGYQYFDILEYGESFEPSDLPEYILIADRLKELESIAPKTAKFLESLFLSPWILWSFVEPSLVEVPPTGSSKLIITSQRVQAAIADTQKYTVQINKNVWQTLDAKSRAFLLLHEALWFADRSTMAYQYLNEEASFLDFHQRGYGGWSATVNVEKLPDFPFKSKALHRRAANVVNLNSIDTTSADIRRQTGFLLGKSFSEHDDASLRAVSNFICSNSGSVNLQTNVLFTARNAPGFIFKVNWFLVRSLKEAPYGSDKTALCTILQSESEQ